MIWNLVLALPLSHHETSGDGPGIAELGSLFCNRLMVLIENGHWDSQMRSCRHAKMKGTKS